MRSVKLTMTLNVDLSKASDAYVALGMVEGVEIVEVQAYDPTSLQVKKESVTPREITIQQSLLPDPPKRSAPNRKYNAVYDQMAETRIGAQGKKVLDVEKTLKKLGISKGYLMNKHCRRGTLEHSLKMSISNPRNNKAA